MTRACQLALQGKENVCIAGDQDSFAKCMLGIARATLVAAVAVLVQLGYDKQPNDRHPEAITKKLQGIKKSVVGKKYSISEQSFTPSISDRFLVLLAHLLAWLSWTGGSSVDGRD